MSDAAVMICSPTLNEQLNEAARAVGEQLYTRAVEAHDTSIKQQVVTQMLLNWAASLRRSAEMKQAKQLEEEREMDGEPQESQELGPHSTDCYSPKAHAAVLDPEDFFDNQGRSRNTNRRGIPDSVNSWKTRVPVPEEGWDGTWKPKKKLRSSRNLRKGQDGITHGSQSAWRRAAKKCRFK